MKTIALLGSTGSIGVSTLALVREFPDRFTVFGMVAGRNLKLLAQQIKDFTPDASPFSTKPTSCNCDVLGRAKVEIFFGEKGASTIATATEVDVVLAAIVGGAGLMPTLKGLLAGKEIALANKEALVMAGEIFVESGKGERGSSVAGGQRAQRHFPVSPGERDAGSRQNHSYGFRRAVFPRATRST